MITDCPRSAGYNREGLLADRMLAFLGPLPCPGPPLAFSQRSVSISGFGFLSHRLMTLVAFTYSYLIAFIISFASGGLVAGGSLFYDMFGYDLLRSRTHLVPWFGGSFPVVPGPLVLPIIFFVYLIYWAHGPLHLQPGRLGPRS